MQTHSDGTPAMVAARTDAGESRAAVPLSDSWRRWIAENKLLQIGDDQLVATLLRNGVEAGVASREVAAAGSHPYFQAAERMAQRLRKLESLMDVHHALSSLAFGSAEVERRGRISRAEFLERYYAVNRPVILAGLMAGWPALSRWSPEYLKGKCGSAAVEIMSGRNRDPRYEINSGDHKTSVRFADYIDKVVAAGQSNDEYLVANNGFLSRPEMKALADDLRSFPEHLDPARTDGQVFFWFGPGGTVTPLHHDVMNILLSQIYGRKQVTLISPDQTHRVYNEVGVYSEVDVEKPDYQRHPLFRGVKSIRVILEPGETLFLPVGWWHHVKALDVSITVTFTNFVHLNHFAWSNPRPHG